MNMLTSDTCMRRQLVYLGCAAVLSVFSGCAAPDADWYGDREFTAEERETIETSSAWLARSAGREPPIISWNYERTSGVLPHTIRRESPPVASATGFCTSTDGNGTVYLDVARTEHLGGLAAHELAHCTLGLHDDVDSEGIMHVIETMRWTSREQAQLDELLPGGGTGVQEL